VLGQVDATIDRGAERVEPEDLERQPELDRP